MNSVPPEDRNWKDKLRGDNEPDWLDRLLGYAPPEDETREVEIEPGPGPDRRIYPVEAERAERIPPRENDAGQRVQAAGQSAASAGCAIMSAFLFLILGVVLVALVVMIL